VHYRLLIGDGSRSFVIATMRFYRVVEKRQWWIGNSNHLRSRQSIRFGPYGPRLYPPCGRRWQYPTTSTGRLPAIKPRSRHGARWPKSSLGNSQAPGLSRIWSMKAHVPPRSTSSGLSTDSDNYLLRLPIPRFCLRRSPRWYLSRNERRDGNQERRHLHF